MRNYIRFKKIDEEIKNTITFELIMGGYYIFDFDYKKLWNYIEDYYNRTGILLAESQQDISKKNIKILSNLISEQIAQVVEFEYRCDEKYIDFEYEYVTENKSNQDVYEKAIDRAYIHSFFYIAKKKKLITNKEINEFREHMSHNSKGEYKQSKDIYIDRLLYLMIKARIIYIQKCFPILNANIKDIEKYTFEELKKQH